MTGEKIETLQELQETQKRLKLDFAKRLLADHESGKSLRAIGNQRRMSAEWVRIFIRDAKEAEKLQKK